MELKIRTNGTRVSDGLQEFIDRRISKIDRLASKVVDAQLELRTENTRSGNPVTTAQLTLHTGKHILRAEERADEPAKAIDAAIDKLIVQVKKFNGKRRHRRRRDGDHPMNQIAANVNGEFPETISFTEPLIPDGEDLDNEEPDIRIKRFSVKPMIVDEAVDQMELLGHDFFLFHNADEDRLNVVYKRRDGAYGLLAPDAS